MRAFRGTLVLAVVLAVAWAAVRLLDPGPRQEGGPPPPELFSFEKSDVVRVEIQRPSDRIVMARTDSGWVIEGPGFPASRSMVNRVKHQLHDLSARATVIEHPGDLALYGLGPQVIDVKVGFKDGGGIHFQVGDPNPSGVSYYLRPLPGDTIYTVKKSSMDYYSDPLDEFRERRFASFDSKDADGLESRLRDGRRLRFQRSGEHLWEMIEPLQMGASRDEVRSLLGRVSALKVRDFVEDLPPEGGDLSRYGLDHPRLTVTVHFANREPLTLLVGAHVPGVANESRAWMKIEGDGAVVTARDALIDEYSKQPLSFRRRRFMGLSQDQVVEIRVQMRPGSEDDLSGSVVLRLLSDTWQWDDGVPVPGSTPSRVALRISGVRADEFVDDHPPSLRRYGLDDPRARVTLVDQQGAEHTLLIGDKGPSRTGAEDREIERYYVKSDDADPVYLADRGVLQVVRDAIREHRRHQTGQDDRERRHEAIDAAHRLVKPVP